MPAAYAHITLVNLMIDRLPSLSNELGGAVRNYLKYCELGSVSPDYPYLDIVSSSSKSWADKMHHNSSMDFIREGITLLRDINSDSRQKLTAWLLGYASHVTADCVIHPVVNKIAGGIYTDGFDIASAHRRCEMSQDLYVYKRLNMGSQETTEHLDSGIKTCCAADDPNMLDPDIHKFWVNLLQKVYKDFFVAEPPEPDKWHKRFCFLMDNLVEEGFSFIPFARHVAYEGGLTYPEKPIQKHIHDLPTPSGTLEYDQVFDQAMDQVVSIWDKMASAIYGDEPTALADMPNLNLDTGIRIDQDFYYWGRSK